jgi:translation initiation factor IF-3
LRGGNGIKNREARVNEQIRISPIRLIGPDGEQIGIIPTKEALDRAREAGLDLVEVSPNSRPPVCRILDYGKYKYNQAKKAASSKKRQHMVSIKGMRFRPKIEEHDYQFKMKHVREFLEQGNKVKCFVLFRGREKAHTEFGREILDRLAQDLKEIATIENLPKMEGHSMTMLLSPQASAVRKPQDKPADHKKKSRKSDGPDQPPEEVVKEDSASEN